MAEVKFFSTMRKAAGTSSVHISNGISVEEAMNEMLDRIPELKERIYDEKGKLKDVLNIFVNGKNIATLEGTDTVLEEEDSLAFFRPIGGG